MLRLKFLFSSLAVVAAAACAPVFNGEEQSLTVEARHPISVDAQTMVMEITAERTDYAVSAVDKARLKAFAGAYLDKGHGPLTLTFPSGSQNVKVSVAFAAEMRQTLNGAGVPWSALEGASYRAPGDAEDATVFLTFTKYVATASPCGDWSDNLATSQRNMPWRNFGCSTQANFAAMVADSRDLVEPAADAPADVNRRTEILGKYRRGEVTSAEVDNQSKITLNDAVQGQ